MNQAAAASGGRTPRPGIRAASLRTVALLLGGMILLSVLPRIACAEQRLLRPNEDASAAIASLQPGDELVLGEGLFGPLDFAALVGTAEAPIVIRGRARMTPATIRAGDFGIRLAGARHLIIQDIAIAGASRAAVLIEHGPRSAAGVAAPTSDLRLRGITALRPEALSCDSIRIVGAARITLSGLQLEECGATGIALEDAREIVITESVLSGRTNREPVGVRIATDCAEIAIRSCTFAGGFSSGVVLGAALTPTVAPAADAPAPVAARSARAVTIERCGFMRSRAAWTLGAVHDARISHCTVSSPEGSLFRVEAVEAVGVGALRSAVISHNLFHWLPNDLTALAAVAPGTDTSFIELGPNLWWAADFAAAPTALGPFPGRVVEAQVVDLDPRLDDADRPFAAGAARFGRHAAHPPTAPAAPAGGSDAEPPPVSTSPEMPSGNDLKPTVSSSPRTP